MNRLLKWANAELEKNRGLTYGMELNLEICRTSLAMSRSFSKFTCKMCKEKIFSCHTLMQQTSNKQFYSHVMECEKVRNF